MTSIIESLAFVKVPVTYGKNVSHLKFVKREEMHFSSISSFDIPVRHLHVNDNWQTLLMCHGNAEDIGHNHLETLSSQFNANICMFDYAGYGLHTCDKSSESNCQKDVLAVYDYLINDMKIDPGKIVIYGRSLGTAIAVFLAHHVRNDHYQPKKLLLISPLMSAVKVVTNSWVPIDAFMNYQLAPEIKCSTLILHGDRDQVISWNCGYELSTKFKNLYKFFTLKNCGHNDLFIPDFYQQVNQFLKL